MDIPQAIQSKKMGTIQKPQNYYQEYERFFAEKKDQKIRILEIGIEKGGSLYTWAEWFPNAEIIGIDIDEECRKFKSDRVHIFIGDQEDTTFLDSIPGNFDIIIDDGGHTMGQQQTSFNSLFSRLNENGIYVIEDIHTSYWSKFGGAIYKGDSTIEFLKSLIEVMHFWAVNHPRVNFFHRIKWGIKRRLGFPHNKNPKTYLQKWIRSIYIADSICFIFKGKTERSTAETVL